MDAIRIQELRVKCIIGDEAWERTTPQEICIDLELGCGVAKAGASDRLADTVDYAAVAKTVLAYTRESRFHLIEALAEGIAQVCLQQFPIASVAVQLTKPSHIPDVQVFQIRIERRRL